jgi:SAM-dependent methyltransferase
MTEQMDSKSVIAHGYDRMGSDFEDWNNQLPSEDREWFRGEVLSRLPEGSLVLDAGCGPGTDAPVLSKGRRYVGLDLSPVQLAIARRHAPTGMFVCGDITSTAFRGSSFDGIAAFYLFNHVPQAQVRFAFAACFEWLRQEGHLMLAGMPTFPDEDRVHEWLGVPMFFAGIEPGAFDASLREVGFEIDISRLGFGKHEPWGWSEPRWIIARKPA